MLKALYYPRTRVTSPVILKNALVLWDTLETIAPYQHRRPNPSGMRNMPGDRTIDEASELIVRYHVPTLGEKQEAHRALETMLKAGLLATLMSIPSPWAKDDFMIYPEKFLDKTWRLLEHGANARYSADAEDYGVPLFVGYLVMSLLADACAGTQVQKITDLVAAYTWLSKQHAQALGSPHVLGLDVSQIAPAHDRLITISLDALNLRAIPLKRLIAFRKRELRRGGADYSAMRRRYLKALQTQLKRISTEAKSTSDIREIERQFREELRDDLNNLKSELNVTSLKALLSKEVAVGTLISAGCLVAPIAGVTALATQFGALGVIPLLKAATEYRGARRNALQRHTSSWLYLGAMQPRLSLQ